MARLVAYVHVQDAQGAMHVFGPADEVPEWAQERITNPKAWDKAPAGKGESSGTQNDGQPPRSGKGSSTDVWAEYAAQQGVDVPDDASREDIIAACDAAGSAEAE